MTNKYMKNKISLALGLWLVAGYSAGLPVLAAQSVSICNISVNKDKQLVVDFDNPNHLAPVAPQVLDFPGQQHDIVLEFPNTSFELSKIPRARTVLDELTKVFPDVKSIAYATNNDASRARIRLSISENVSTHPILTKVDQDSVVIDLGFPVADKNAGGVTANAANNPEAAHVAQAGGASMSLDSAAPARHDSHASRPLSPAPTISTSAGDLNGQNTPAQESSAAVVNSPAVTSTENEPPANTPAVTKGNSATGLKDKTVTGIKGAWQSSLKAGHNFSKLNPFASKKQAKPTIASADAPADKLLMLTLPRTLILANQI